MKNFKKVLALVLAVVMVMAMVVNTSAAAKDFTDAADIDNTEAVDVLSYLDVMVGFPAGDFQPKAFLNRAEAAKIVAIFDNADPEISSYYAGACKFADCKDSWAKSYIGYCVKNGIIAGYNATTFGPKDTLTGVQFLKMVLTVLGYDADVVGLVGPDWDVNTLYLAKKAGLVGTDFDGFVALTREEAAQILLNALKAEIVQSGDAFSLTWSDDKYQLVRGADKFAKTDKIFGEEAFEVYYVDGENLANVDADAFGTPAYQWVDKSGKKDVTIGSYASEPILVYDDVVKTCDLLKDLGVEEKDDTVVTVDAYIKNGEKASSGELSHDSDGACYDVKNSNDDLKQIGAAGAMTKVYDIGTDDDGNQKIVITTVEMFIGEVNKITEDKHGEDAKMYLGDNWYADEFAGELSDYEKGDYVLYNKGKNDYTKVLGVVEPSKNGKLKGENSSKVDLGDETLVKGSRYVVNTIDAGVVVDGYTYETELGNEFVIMLKEVAANKFIGAIKTIAWANSGSLLDDECAKAIIVKADDASLTEIVTVTGFEGDAFDVAQHPQNPSFWDGLVSIDKAKNCADVFTYRNDEFDDVLCEFTIDADGNYTITAVADDFVDNTDNDDLVITKGKVNHFVGEINSTKRFYTDENTVFLVKTGSTYATYEGFKNVPSMKLKKGTYNATYMVDTKDRITYFYIDATNADFAGDSVIGWVKSYDGEGKGSYNKFTVTKLDGTTEKLALVTGFNKDTAPKGLVELSLNADGKVLKATSVGVRTTINNDIKNVSDNVLTGVNNKEIKWTLADDCKFFLVEGWSITEKSLKDLADVVEAKKNIDNGVEMYAFYPATGDGDATAVYYTVLAN